MQQIVAKATTTTPTIKTLVIIVVSFLAGVFRLQEDKYPIFFVVVNSSAKYHTQFRHSNNTVVIVLWQQQQNISAKLLLEKLDAIKTHK